MKILLSIFLFLSIASSQSNMIKFSNAYQDSIKYGEDYYFAWKIRGLDSILIVAEGYSDGIDYSFYRISNTNKLALLFRFNPVLIDSTITSSQLFWGYPWDIGDIEVKWFKKELRVLTSFNHSIKRDGVIDIPDWQKILPAIYFRGKTTQSKMTITGVGNKQYMSISKIQAASK